MGCCCSRAEGWVFTALHPKAKIPVYATPGSAGADIYAVEDSLLEPGSTTVVPIGLATKVPRGHYCRIAGRSGLAANHGVFTFPGVVDPDYHEQIKIIFYNSSQIDYHIREGQRIAQLVCERFGRPPCVLRSQPFDINARGGFGSTGY